MMEFHSLAARSRVEATLSRLYGRPRGGHAGGQPRPWPPVANMPVSSAAAPPGAAPLRCLLVGAGAVGLTYGTHLARGGAQVSFLVKEKYAAAARAGFTVHRLNARATERFVPHGVLTEAEQVQPGDFDQIWLCIPSDALRSGPVEALLARLGTATLVAFQPGLLDHAWLAARVPEAQLVQGLIALIAYPAPLPGEARSPGTAWWFPPLTRSPFSGPRAPAVVGALRAGGCPAKVARKVQDRTAFASSLMMPIIAALEGAGWSFQRLFGSAAIGLGTAASREANAIAAPGGLGLVRWLASRPLLLRLVAAVGRRVVPFDLEVYLQVHFSKVGTQTMLMLRTYIERGAELRRPTGAIEALTAALAQARGEASVAKD